MKRILTVTLIMLFLASSLQAGGTDSANLRKRPKVAVVFSGGGAKGMAHIGALKVLEETGIPVDYVVGTSIGSIIGGFYALGYKANELDSLVRVQDWDLIMKDHVKRRDVYFTYKEDNDRFIVTIPFVNRKNLLEETEANGPRQKDLLRNMPGALVDGQNLDQLFTKLSVGYQDDIDFNDLPIPFACVAVDLNTKEEVVFRRGNIVTAIRSSMSIPGYFTPVRHNNQYLVDGGMLNNLPVDVAKEMGADYIITIDLHSFKKSKEQNDQTIPEMISTMLSIMNGEKYKSGRNISDIIIEPNTSDYGVLAFDEKSVDALVDSGVVAAKRVLPQLVSLANHLKEYPADEETRPARAIDLNRESVMITQIEIKGTDAGDMGWLLSKTDISPGNRITGADMDDAMAFFYNTKCFSKASYSVAGTGEGGGYNLKIKLDPQRVHQAGFGFRFDSEEMASLLLGLSLNKRRLFGPKLNLEFELGANPNAEISFSHTFRNLAKLMLAVKGRHTRMDVFKMTASPDENGTEKNRYGLASDDRYNVLSTKIGYGFTGFRSFDIQIGAQYNRYLFRTIGSEETAPSQSFSYNDHTWTGFVNFKFDNLDDSYFPKKGLKLDIEGNSRRNKDGWFHDGVLNLKAAVPFSEKVCLVPQLYNRMIFAGTPSRMYSNYVGGSMKGRYLEHQLPFIGINNTYMSADMTNIARADLRINLFQQHYLTLMANYMLEYTLHDFIGGHLGAGINYSLNTIIGPIGLTAHWSTLSRKAGFYLSIGFDF